MEDKWRPEIVMGIDFGMTCTGVAYSMSPDWSEPKTLQHWPPRMISELANKVPTTLQYHQTVNDVKAWGFLCESDEDLDVVDCFKLHLDPEYADPRPNAPSSDQARQWYRDYLRCLHDYIAEEFLNSYVRWKQTPVEFIFSVPTTWKNPSMIVDILALIKEAGFGSDGSEHRVQVGLTEAEAAAVYASRHQIEKDDVILVCDAGGGTTDVNTLKVQSERGNPTELCPLSWSEGRPIGSTLIDIQFHRMLSDRLEIVKSQLEGEPAEMAHRMMHGKFERIKCTYGTTASLTLPTIPLAVPGLPPGFHSAEAHIEESLMIIEQGDLKALFDVQVARMLELIDEQLQRLEQKEPQAQVSYLVLSGGLGSSPYVRQRLKPHFDDGPGSSRTNVEDMHVVTVIEPQLAVVHGLVLDRIQFLKRGELIFKQRCCRNSYGVKCLQEYLPGNTRHMGQAVIFDKRDGKRYVENQIDWFVKQGESVSDEGIAKPYVIMLKPGEEQRTFHTTIVMSSNEVDKLPTNMSQDGVKPLCSVESDLKNHVAEIKVKNRHWYNRKAKYLQLRINMQVMFGPADLKFQLRSKDEKLLSRDHKAIQVKWEAPAGQAKADQQQQQQRKHELEGSSSWIAG